MCAQRLIGAGKYFSEARPYEVLYIFDDGRVHAATEGGIKRSGGSAHAT